MSFFSKLKKKVSINNLKKAVVSVASHTPIFAPVALATGKTNPRELVNGYIKSGRDATIAFGTGGAAGLVELGVNKTIEIAGRYVDARNVPNVAPVDQRQLDSNYLESQNMKHQTPSNWFDDLFIPSDEPFAGWWIS